MKPPSSSLTELFRLEEDAGELWRSDEAADILMHQLQAPLAADLAGVNLDEHETGLTFGQLLAASDPSVELLRRVKEFAKSSGANSDRLLPREVAALLYIAAIAVARGRCGESISEQSDEAVRQKLQWAVSQDWISVELRAVLAEVAEQI